MNTILLSSDSVMAIFPLEKSHSSGQAKTERELIREAFAVGEKAAREATTIFGDCNELECEKTALPYLLFKKKTYCARVFEDPDGDPKLDVKGLAVVRRDCCEWVANTLRQTLNELIMERSVSNAKSVIETQLHRLVNCEVTIPELTLSKRLSGSYKSQNLPQLTVVRKMEQRNKGSAPKSGDRVAFCIIEGGPKQKIFDRAEDVTFIANNHDTVKVDRMHYLTNELMKPVCQLFGPFHPNPRQLFEGAEMELERQRKGHVTLFSVDWLAHAPTRKVDNPQPVAKKRKTQQTLLC